MEADAARWANGIHPQIPFQTSSIWMDEKSEWLNRPGGLRQVSCLSLASLPLSLSFATSFFSFAGLLILFFSGFGGFATQVEVSPRRLPSVASLLRAARASAATAMEFLPSRLPLSPLAGGRDGVKEDAEGDEDGENEVLFAEFLESEVLGHDADDPALPEITQGEVDSDLSIQTGNFGRVPPELFQNILRFLSSEDLSTCTSVCRFLRGAASDEGLWRRLYCLRWGRPPNSDRPGKPRGCAWKKLYFERDEADMVDFVRNTPLEFREYYIQMQAAKRSQAPLPSQVHDDLVVVDSSMADQITAWRRSQKLADAYLGDHWCSGKTCSYYQIDDVFLCEKTGRAHICDDSCREIVLDPSNELLVCTVSGRCFDRWITPAEEDDAEPGQQQADANAAAEEVEPFLGSCRLGRAYLLGYNCADERELDAVVREVLYPSQKKTRYCYHGC